MDIYIYIIIYQSEPIEKVVSLSKKSFSKDSFQLLNKDLNFVLTPDVYNKHKLNEVMETFYKTTKLKGYMKDLT